MLNDVLVVAAHGDDEVLGAGGTLYSHAQSGDRIHLLVLSEGDSSRYPNEPHLVSSRKAAIEASAEVLGVASLDVMSFPDSRFDVLPLLDFVKIVEDALVRVNASIVYTHSVGDLHSDHRVAATATVTACRPFHTGIQSIMSFEVRSSSDWAEASGVTLGFSPNFWSVLPPEAVAAKMRALDCYEAEVRAWPHSRSKLGVEALLAHRGAQVHREAAEAFQVLRIINSIHP
jgi:LmbE family N-acetylglucosaminyl deacetylase